MIYYLVSARHQYTLRPYLTEWRRNLASAVRILPYRMLPAHLDLPGGCYTFF